MRSGALKLFVSSILICVLIVVRYAVAYYKARIQMISFYKELKFI